MHTQPKAAGAESTGAESAAAANAANAAFDQSDPVRLAAMESMRQFLYHGGHDSVILALATVFAEDTNDDYGQWLAEELRKLAVASWRQ